MATTRFVLAGTPFLVAAVIGIGGCANGVNLKPAPSASQSGTADNAVVNTVDGVRMKVKVDTWSGNPDVLQDVTPLRVHIENHSSEPLQISYDNFALISLNGQRYSALPPIQIQGNVNKRISSPGFAHSGFAVAPYYGSTYSGITPYSGTFGHNSGYYNSYYNRWRTIDVALPTQHMQQVAIPDGVLKPGGSLEGYLYFEKVPTDTLARVRFRADLVNPATSTQIGTISIPFVTPKNK